MQKKSTFAIILLIFTFVIRVQTYAQIIVDTSFSAQDLANSLVGANVTISNVILNCDDAARGSFISTTGALAIDSGVLLTTGRAKTINNCPGAISTSCFAPGVSGASSFFASKSNGITIQDTFITSITTAVQRDRCNLEFDFVTLGDTIQFNYIFGSEEYPMFNCSNFNDAFGIFLTGPGISGKKNIALIPGTNIPVCINSINGSTSPNALCTNLGSGAPFTSLYVDNGTGYMLTYNGHTVVMNAKSYVVPNQTHHIAFAIADIFDYIYDSGVFIEGRSLVSNPFLSAYFYSTGDMIRNPDYVIETCGPGRFHFRTAAKVPNPVQINLSYGGNVISGVDYNALPTSVTIPANDSFVNLPLTAIADNLTEPNDSLIVYASGPNFLDTFFIKFKDFGNGISVYNQSNDSNICNYYTSNLYCEVKDNMAFKIKWSPATYLSADSILNPVFKPNVININDTLKYYVKITHASCPDIDSVVKIKIMLTPKVSLGNDTTICKGDTIQLYPLITPTNNYTYKWSYAQYLSSDSISNPIAYPPAHKIYLLSVITDENCIGYDDKLIQVLNIKSEIDSIGLTNTNCFKINGQARIYLKNPTLNFKFKLNNRAYQSTNLITNLSDTIHKLTIKMNDICTIDTFFSITSSRPKISVIDTPATCDLNNGKLNATASNAKLPLLFKWSNGILKPSNSNLDSGNYTVILIDGDGCEDTLKTYLSRIPKVNFSLESKNLNCNDGLGSIKSNIIIGIPPITYLWSNGKTTDSIVDLISGNYKVTVKDLYCSKMDSVVIQNFINPKLSYTSKPVTCIIDKGKITLNPSLGTPPYIVTLKNDTGLVFSNLNSKTYNIKIRDKNNCKDSIDVFIDSIVKFSTTTNVIKSYCELPNGKINTQTIKGSPPYTYIWNNGEMTKDILNLKSNNYQLTISDQYNCKESYSLILENVNPNFKNNSTYSNLACFQDNSGKINLDLIGGISPLSFSINNSVFNSNSLVQNLAAQKYVYRIKDSLDCIYTDSVILTQPPKLSTNLISILNPSCFNSNNGEITTNTLGGTKPYIYNWSNGSSSSKLSNLTQGNYILNVLDSNYCQVVDTFKLIAPLPFNVQSKLVQKSCIEIDNGLINIDVTGATPPYRYLWNTGSIDTKISNLKTGFYSVSITDKNNCIDSKLFEIIKPVPLKFELFEYSHPSCFGFQNGKINVELIKGNYNTYSYYLNSEFSKIGKFYNLKADNYHIKAKDNIGCQYDTFIKLIEPEKLNLRIDPKDTIIDLGESITYSYQIKNLKTEISNLLWAPNSGLSCSDCSNPNANPYTTSTYILTILDSNQCEISDTAILRIKDETAYFVPNIFTPNGDNQNDELKVYGKNISKAELSIFNRWGEKVFESKNANLKGWNGEYKSKKSPQGVYSYTIMIEFLNLKKVESKGSITLIY